MRWIAVLVLLLAGCEKKKDTAPDKPPGRDPAGSGTATVDNGGGSATTSTVSDFDPVKAMTSIVDEICACKDEACAKSVVEKRAGELDEKLKGVKMTPELGKQLGAIQGKAMKCMRAFAKAGEGPSDPRLKAPTKDDLAAYLKDISPATGKLTATITTSMGAFTCELFPDKSPATVANFVGLATGKKPWRDPATKAVVENKPFYNGLIFHRVIPGFMIQGGDPLGTGTGGPGYEFDDETDNGLTVDPGVLAMANAGPGTNGSQFFIMEGRAEHLDGHHTVFGKCAEVDLVKKITNVEKECTGCSQNDPKHDRPKTPVTIKSITFARK
jgi:peptidyl-prolyl cis-trans isomerase A (cyclophilin A)